VPRVIWLILLMIACGKPAARAPGDAGPVDAAPDAPPPPVPDTGPDGASEPEKAIAPEVPILVPEK
jgi:hypothetical protein